MRSYILTFALVGLEGPPVDRQNVADISQELCSKCRSPGSAIETSLGPSCWSSVPKQAGNLNMSVIEKLLSLYNF